LAAATIVSILIDRRDEIITAAITTIVIMVVAMLNPADALSQPLLRVLDTGEDRRGGGLQFRCRLCIRRRGHGAGSLRALPLVLSLIAGSTDTISFLGLNGFFWCSSMLNGH
jgi:hypothetical protein